MKYPNVNEADLEMLLPSQMISGSNAVKVSQVPVKRRDNFLSKFNPIIRNVHKIALMFVSSKV